MGKRLRVALLVFVAVAIAYALYENGPIPQSERYHHFADTRVFFGIANAVNVLTNIPFLIVGLLGLAFLKRGPTRDPEGPFRPGAHTAFESLRERPAYVLFFVGVLLTTFGSGYYHLGPTTMSLFWDRLPMAVGFAALFAAMIAERVSVYWSRMLLLPLVFTGIASVVAWRISEITGHSDLRAYVFVQVFPLVALPVMMLLFRPRYSHGAELLIAVVVYGVAKVFEYFDGAIWDAFGHSVSGHSIKHIVAAIATWLVLDMLKRRGRPPVPLTEALLQVDEEGPPPSFR